jgi:hypothetical protein
MLQTICVEGEPLICNTVWIVTMRMCVGKEKNLGRSGTQPVADSPT